MTLLGNSEAASTTSPDAALEVGDYGGEDLVDGGRVLGVVFGAAAGVGDRLQRVDIRIGAVGDREHPNRVTELALVARAQRGQEVLKLLVVVVLLAVVVLAVGEENDGVDASRIEVGHR